MTMEYTKGEWVADIRTGVVTVHIKDDERYNCLDGLRDQCIYWASGHYVHVGFVGGHWAVTEEPKANAHLIAAAPELYEACQVAYRWYYQGAGGDYRLIGDQLKQALAKAEGK